jgi:endonuclease YncB( thermonuclease family)
VATSTRPLRRGKHTLVAVVASLTGIAPGHAAPPDALHARCAEVRGFHDGDTFACLPEGTTAFVVRVASIDTPETGQGYWRVARERLRELVGSGSAVDCYKRDRYDRRVCRVQTPEGADVAAVMLGEVRSGLRSRRSRTGEVAVHAA